MCLFPCRGTKKAKVGGKLSVQAVNTILKAHGIDDQGSCEVSQCLKAGILYGHVKLLKPQDDPENKRGLDQVRPSSLVELRRSSSPL